MSKHATIGTQVFIGSAMALCCPAYTHLKDKPGHIVGFIGGHAFVRFDQETTDLEERRHRKVHLVRQGAVNYDAFRLALSVLVTREPVLRGGVHGILERRLDGTELSHTTVERAAPAKHPEQGTPAQRVPRMNQLTPTARQSLFQFKEGDKVQRKADHSAGARYAQIGDVGTVVETNGDRHNFVSPAYLVKNHRTGETGWWLQTAVRAVPVETPPQARVNLGVVVLSPAEEKARATYFAALVDYRAWNTKVDETEKLLHSERQVLKAAYQKMMDAATALQQEMNKAAGVDL